MKVKLMIWFQSKKKPHKNIKNQLKRFGHSIKAILNFKIYWLVKWH